MSDVEALRAQIAALQAEKDAAAKKQEETDKRIERANKDVEAAKKKEREAQKKIEELEANDPATARMGQAIATAMTTISSKRDSDRYKPTFRGRWGWDKKKMLLADGTSETSYEDRKTTPIPSSVSIKAFPSSIAKAPIDCVGLVATLGILCPMTVLSGSFIVGGALHGIHGRIFINTAKAQTADENTLRFWLEKDEHMDHFSWKQASYLMRAVIEWNTENFPELVKRYWTHVTEVDMRTTISAWPVYLLYDCLIRERMSACLANREFPTFLGVWDEDLFNTARARFGASLDDVTQKVVPDAWSKVVAVPEKGWPDVRDALIAIETKLVKGEIALHPPSLAALKVAGSMVPTEIACPSYCRTIAPIHSSASSSKGPLVVGNSQQRNYGSSNSNSNQSNQYSNQTNQYSNQSNQYGNGGNRAPSGRNSSNYQGGNGGARDQPFRQRLCIGCGKQGHSIGACSALFPRLERIPTTSNTGAVSYKVHSREGNKLPICLAYNINDHHRDNCGCEDLCSKCGGKHPLVAHQGLGLAEFAILNLQ